MQKNEMTLSEAKNVLSYLIDNNRKLADKGDTPISACLESEAGVGKTAVVRQLAAEKGMTLAMINLAQLEEPSELVGFPYKEYEVDCGSGKKWISSDILSQTGLEFTATGESRMAYASPSWLPREENPSGTILLLDDFSRANNLIIQAVMEIINTGSYVSWKLPKHTTVLLTSNPDNSQYEVQSLDLAVKTRMCTFSVRFDINEWAAWAEKAGIDGRAINFAVLYADEIFRPKNNVFIANARSYTTFCRAIGSLRDWENPSSLALILQIASGCFLSDDNVIGNLFVRFVSDKLDRLVTPERIITGEEKAVRKEVLECVGEGSDQRVDLAALIVMRLTNWCDAALGAGMIKGPELGQKLSAFMDKSDPLFPIDAMFSLIRTLNSRHPSKTSTWFRLPNMIDVIL